MPRKKTYKRRSPGKISPRLSNRKAKLVSFYATRKVTQRKKQVAEKNEKNQKGKKEAKLYEGNSIRSSQD